MNRTHRRFVAWLGILGIAFAQLAVTAHACTIRVQVPASVAAVPATPHHRHCSGQHASAPLAPQGNACELQCSEAAPTSAMPDLPPVALSALTVAIAPAASPGATRAYGRSLLAANSAAPPLSLQFCRLLI